MYLTLNSLTSHGDAESLKHDSLVLQTLNFIDKLTSRFSDTASEISLYSVFLYLPMQPRFKGQSLYFPCLLRTLNIQIGPRIVPYRDRGPDLGTFVDKASQPAELVKTLFLTRVRFKRGAL